MIILILTRILDVYSTLINVNKWGYEVEGNPFIRGLMEKGLFIPAQIVGIILVIIIAELLPKYRKIIYISISAFSLLASIINFSCYFFIN